MDEYIEKHKVVNLLTALENECQQFKPFKGFEHAMYRKLCETEITIGKLPAADVVAVVHGEWTPYGIGKGMTFCSNCEYNGKREYRYCPNCGAKMDGGANDD